jgi:replicative DNA helicase
MLAKFNSASALISQSGLVVESGFTDMESIDASARDLAGKGNADLVIVDYVQLVHLRAMASNETREQHVSEITRRLKALALQLNIAVATASQLNEDGKLRESRAIGMHSDHVWMIRHGDESFISLDKNRDGERGHAVPVQMDGAIAKFTQQQES